MGKGVAITGMGIISAIGNNVQENYTSLIHSKTGIAKISKIDTIHKDAILVGEIETGNSAFEKQLGLAENSWSRTSLLAVVAAKEAITQAGITNINDCRTGLISATTVGGMDKSEQYFYNYFETDTSWKYINSLHAGDSTQKIAQQLGLEESFVTTISTACSSAANAIMLGARMIKAGELDRVIVGGSDALSKFTINGFKTLMILSDTYRYVKGYANANDAHHQTASSDNGDGAVLAMEKALKIANLEPQAVDYVNAHGTATPNNDLSEGRALLRVFDKHVPEFSSTKAYTGHTLAVAGAVEAVYSMLALEHNVIYPNLNFKNPMKEFDLLPETELKEKELNVVLSNSFGFGGNCTTLIFSKEA